LDVRGSLFGRRRNRGRLVVSLRVAVIDDAVACSSVEADATDRAPSYVGIKRRVSS